MARVVVADDEQSVAEMFRRVLAREGYGVEVVHDGVSAVEAVRELQAARRDLRRQHARDDGARGLPSAQGRCGDGLTPVVLVTGMAHREKRIEGLEAGADDFLTKPIDTQELLARVRTLVRMKRYTDDLDSAASLITAMALLVEARDGNTEGHCHRMANYATALGRALASRRKRSRRCTAAASCTTSACSPSPTPCCASPVRSRPKSSS